MNYYGIEADNMKQWFEQIIEQYNLSLYDFEDLDYIYIEQLQKQYEQTSLAQLQKRFDFLPNPVESFLVYYLSDQKTEYSILGVCRWATERQRFPDNQGIDEHIRQQLAGFEPNSVTQDQLFELLMRNPALEELVLELKNDPLFAQIKKVKTFGFSQFPYVYSRIQLGLDKVTVVDHYGGEGKGELYYTVFHHEPTDEYVKLEGFYSSYGGVTYDNGFQLVKPTVKQVVVYE